MLQEISENDLQYVNAGTSKKNLLIVYNEMRIHQKELELENFYFQDNFYWKANLLSHNKLDKMISGKEKFHYNAEYDFSQDKWKSFIKDIKNTYGNKYSWARDNFQTKHYISILLNKLSFTEEYYLLLKNNKNEGNKDNNKEKKENIKAQIKNHWKKDSIKENAYIYGIVIDDKIVYIGKTYRPLNERIAEHIECVLDNSIKNGQQNYLYEAMRKCRGYKFKILYESHNKIDNRELENIEKSMIELCKPKYNYEGVIVPYRYTDEKLGV